MSAAQVAIEQLPISELMAGVELIKELTAVGWRPPRGIPEKGNTATYLAGLGLEFVKLGTFRAGNLMVRRADAERLLRRQREESGREAADDERPAAGDDRLADVMEALERIEARLDRIDFNVEATWLSVIRVRQELGDDSVLDPSAPETAQ